MLSLEVGAIQPDPVISRVVLRRPDFTRGGEVGRAVTNECQQQDDQADLHRYLGRINIEHVLPLMPILQFEPVMPEARRAGRHHNFESNEPDLAAASTILDRSI